MEETKFLVVGAGVSGLAFADWLKSEDYIVCEADSEIGGYCKTVYQDGFTWDYSGHFFHFKNQAIERYLIDRMKGEDVRAVRKSSKIYWDGGWVDFPFQKNIHQLPKEDFVDCIHGLFFRPDVNPANFEEMLHAKFGRGISERFLIPYNKKLYATDLRNLDMNAMGRFFPYADVAQIIGNFKNPENSSYNDTFTYPKGGAIQYVNALAKGVDARKISLQERVLEVDLKRRIARTNLRFIRYENLVSSAPLVSLLKSCGLSVVPDAFSWNKVLVLNLGFDSKGVEDIHWAYFPQEDVCFYRVGFYDNIMDSDRMSLYVEIGLDREAEINADDVERYREKVLADLQRAGVVSGQKLVSSHSVVMDPAYVHIKESSIREVGRVKKILSNHGVHSIGRYGGWTYCSIEDNIVEARDLADTFNAVSAVS